MDARLSDGSRVPESGRADQVDELDLLGWVEGDLPRARQQPVEELLAREPRLRALLDSMSADRATLRTLPPPAAPVDLLSRVESQLERDLLVGLSGPSNDSLAIPISRVAVSRMRGDGVLGRIGRSPALRYASLAASILVAGTVGVVMWPAIVGRSTGPSGLEPSTLKMPEVHASASGPGTSAPAPGADATSGALAAADPAPSLTDLAIAQAEIVQSLAPADESITRERALELLREGRLAIRIRTLDRDRTLFRLASIHAEPRPTWSLLDRADEQVVAALTPKAARVAETIDPSVLASSGESSERPRIQLSIGAEAEPPTRAFYIAETDTTERALGALRGALGAGSNQVAEFVALGEPIVTPDASSIESILWWTRPPSGWVARRTIPIIVDPVGSR